MCMFVFDERCQRNEYIWWIDSLEFQCGCSFGVRVTKKQLQEQRQLSHHNFISRFMYSMRVLIYGVTKITIQVTLKF